MSVFDKNTNTQNQSNLNEKRFQPIRVSEIAKELGQSEQSVLQFLWDNGYAGKKTTSIIPEEAAAIVRAYFGPKSTEQGSLSITEEKALHEKEPDDNSIRIQQEIQHAWFLIDQENYARDQAIQQETNYLWYLHDIGFSGGLSFQDFNMQGLAVTSVSDLSAESSDDIRATTDSAINPESLSEISLSEAHAESRKRTRVYELAEILNRSKQEILQYLWDNGFAGKNASSIVPEDVCEKIYQYFNTNSEEDDDPENDNYNSDNYEEAPGEEGPATDLSEPSASLKRERTRFKSDIIERPNPFADKISVFHSTRAVESMKIHPKNYKEVKGKIIFFLNDRKVYGETAEKVYQALQKAKTLIITSYLKSSEHTRRYSLYLGGVVLQFSESREKNANFFVSNVLKGYKAKERKEDLYNEKIFTIIPSGGVYVINTVDGNRIIRPEGSDGSWSMEPSLYNELIDQMESYFASEDETETVREDITISERFQRNVLRPFRDFTDKENWVEKYKQAQGEGLTFYAQRFERKTNKGNVYTFFSKEPLVIQEEDEEKSIFNIGDRVTIMDTEHGEHGVYTGEIDDIDIDAPEGTAVSVAFYHQSDDEDFPKTGKIIMAVNDTQTRVRNRVIGALERTKVESKYMYKTFSDFSTGGYLDIPDDLKDYVLEKLSEKYPPNQMQLEAIIKGILTEDVLLVLGPPGTGKTTVINYWVEYFIKHGKRVLISSQNNSAVDNVLARFKDQGEIVRLGNEAKVQEDCKEFLPQYKIESMQKHFNENQERVEKELSADWDTIIDYGNEVKKYQDYYKDYAKCYWAVVDALQPIKDIITHLTEIHSQILSCAEEIKNIEADQAHKEIFLAEYSKKNFVVKWFRKKYAALAEAEVADLKHKHRNLLFRHNDLANQYNLMIADLTDRIKQLRERKLFMLYENAFNVAAAQSRILSTSSQYPPTLVSALSRFYTPVKFGSNLNQNMEIAKSEIQAMYEIAEKARKVIKATQTWNDIVNNDRNDIMQTALLETCQIVGATCIGINSNRDFANVKFDVSIVDESGQIQIHNALIPMSRAPINLLLGDYKQIPPSADQDVVAACKAEEIDTKLLEMSFFEYLFESIRQRYIKNDPSDEARENLLKPAISDYDPLSGIRQYNLVDTERMIREAVSDSKKLVNLNRQFRMPGNISSVISEWFYEGNYYSSYDMNRYKPLLPGTERPLIVLSTGKDKNRYEMQPPNGMGYMNKHEASIIAEIVAKVIRSQPEENRDDYIASIEHKMGIISAYGAQVRLIREYIAKSVPEISQKQLRGMVASLDSFQGQERPLIIYSLTRSSKTKTPYNARVGFMKELRRLNVAFTRAQQQLIVVGDVDYLASCMYTQRQETVEEWNCSKEFEPREISSQEILQCSECDAVCERKFARFIRLLLQHVSAGEGELLFTDDIIGRGA